MQLTNIEIQTIWLQPLLCTDKCLKIIATVRLGSIIGNLPRVPIRLKGYLTLLIYFNK